PIREARHTLCAASRPRYARRATRHGHRPSCQRHRRDCSIAPARLTIALLLSSFRSRSDRQSPAGQVSTRRPLGAELLQELRSSRRDALSPDLGLSGPLGVYVGEGALESSMSCSSVGSKLGSAKLM